MHFRNRKVQHMTTIKSLNVSSLIARATTGSILLLIFGLLFFVAPEPVLPTVLLSILGFILAYEMPRLFKNNKCGMWLLTPLYPVLPFVLLISLSANLNYRLLLAFIWALVAIFDSASYFGGIFLGKHLIAPAITPKKTWEGVIAGFLAVSVALIAYAIWRNISLSSEQIIGIAAMIAVLALAGDLFESYLKRKAGLKDSGALLPGHGGLLDRFDSLLFVVVVVYCIKDVLVHILQL